MKRGEIWWADMAVPRGSEPGKGPRMDNSIEYRLRGARMARRDEGAYPSVRDRGATKSVGMHRSRERSSYSFAGPKRRPVVIVQEDAITQSRFPTVMIVPLTSNLRRATAPGNVALARAHTSLSIDSVALASQVMAIDKVFFSERAGALPPGRMRAIDQALRLTLALGE